MAPTMQGTQAMKMPQLQPNRGSITRPIGSASLEPHGMF